MNTFHPHEEKKPLLSFGPVPSRRLGRSLGINNIPPKACTYACVYCQVGRTTEMHGVRRAFYEPVEIFDAVRSRVQKADAAGEMIDYLCFVPDGEPTLDVNLGREIDLLKKLGRKIGVITNGSLLWRADVRQDLKKADWISIKLDARQENVWRKINRPHGILQLKTILGGISEFAKKYRGILVTETMLLRGMNDGRKASTSVAGFIRTLRPSCAYISVPTRPPAEQWAAAPDEQTLTAAYQLFRAELPAVELLVDYEGNEFASTGDIETDLLSITSVHPMREEAVREFLARTGAGMDMIQNLIDQGRLIRIEYDRANFYVRKLDRKNRVVDRDDEKGAK
jgi:wyosine [tRNA(Phe)-imidazoG37] synthetase (radical SAM superfamily)